MSKSAPDLLKDILQEMEDITGFTQGGINAFMVDLKTQKAVVRSYEIIGETCKRLPALLRDSNPQIDWRK
jgi:uncharacterized protein with HEPN domain